MTQAKKGNKCHQEKQHSEENETKRNVSDESNCMIDLWATREWIFYYMCFFLSSLCSFFHSISVIFIAFLGFIFAHKYTVIHSVCMEGSSHEKHLWGILTTCLFRWVCVYLDRLNEWMNEREVARACTHIHTETHRDKSENQSQTNNHHITCHTTH